MLTTLPTRSRLLSLDLITAPTVPVLTTAEAKAHLAVDHDDDDDLIDTLVTAATRRVENMCRRSFVTQTWRVVHKAGTLPLPIFRPPIIALTVVKTWYQGTATTEASITGFYVAEAFGNRPKVMFTDDGEFTATDIEEIEFRYTAGYGAAASAVPPDLVLAVKYALTTAYDRRDEGGASEATLPGIVEDLCKPYIIHTP